MADTMTIIFFSIFCLFAVRPKREAATGRTSRAKWVRNPDPMGIRAGSHYIAAVASTQRTAMVWYDAFFSEYGCVVLFLVYPICLYVRDLDAYRESIAVEEQGDRKGPNLGCDRTRRYVVSETRDEYADR